MLLNIIKLLGVLIALAAFGLLVISQMGRV